MNPLPNHQRQRPTTFAFVGPHRALVTAVSAPPFAYDVGSICLLPETPWATPSGPDDLDHPLVTHLSEQDSSIFLGALSAEQPNEALRQAVARRVVLRG